MYFISIWCLCATVALIPVSMLGISTSKLRLQRIRAIRFLSSSTISSTTDIKHVINPWNFSPKVESSSLLSEKNQTKSLSNFEDRVIVITNRQKAEEILSEMKAAHKSTNWACDTEVADIDVKTQGPVGNGKVVCVSIYGGPHIQWKDGPNKALWIENIDGPNNPLNVFKGWFENSETRKVWHNYGFDRHVMENENISCKGFVGDTMHMARLWNTGRDKASGGGEGYSLEALSREFASHDPMMIKTSMKDLFGVGKPKKDGTESKVKEIPSIWTLQTDERYRKDWIEYSAKDAIATW